MKITLAEFDGFQKSLSGNDWYFEGDEQFVGVEFWDGNYDPAEVIDVHKDDIYLMWQGNGDPPKEEFKDFLTEFKKWKTGIDYEIITVKIPKGKKDDLMKLIKETFKEVEQYEVDESKNE